MIEIKNRYGDVLHKIDKSTLKDAVIEVASKYQSLSGANLSRADLYGANLYGANLYGANLSGANLSRANLYGADLSRAGLSRAGLSRADLSGANLYGANLSGADLSGADLYGANLSGANLYGADLSRANLSGANLYGANLYGANGLNKHRTTPLLMLLDQPGKIRAYKLVTSAWTGPTYPGITYTIGQTYTESNACCDERKHCAAGINLATLDWCMREWQPGQHILIAEFAAKDIAAIPTATDGKFRVKKCKIIREVNLEEIGLIETEKAEAGKC